MLTLTTAVFKEVRVNTFDPNLDSGERIMAAKRGISTVSKNQGVKKAMLFFCTR